MNQTPTIIKKAIIIALLPLVLAREVIISPRSWLKKIGWILLVLLLFGLVWKNAYTACYEVGRLALFDLGITDKLIKVPVRGTSMLPNIKDGEDIELHSPKKFPPQRGDIVSFKSEETGELHYLKRIIGLPGEQITIKNGRVVINGKVIQEDYTLHNLPTFGNTFILDCELKTIPDNTYFVMGDNRTVSHDSRVIGFIQRGDIDGVIKAESQPQLISAMSPETFAAAVDARGLLNLLNERRREAGAIPLTTHNLLNQLAAKRTEQIRNNFGSWKQKTIPVADLLDDNGYRYNLVHEFVTFGYLDNQAIVDQIFDSPQQSEIFLSKKYTEVGVGIIETTNQECTFPVISVILAWPSTPMYDQSFINFWVQASVEGARILTTLQQYVGSPYLNQEKLRELITVVAEATQIASRIADKMKNHQWLTQEDYNDMVRYDQLGEQANTLLGELFGPEIQVMTTEEKD